MPKDNAEDGDAALIDNEGKTDGEVLMDALSTLRGRVEVAATKKDNETPTKLTAAQERDLADLEDKAKGDLMSPSDKDRLVRLRKLKKAYS